MHLPLWRGDPLLHRRFAHQEGSRDLAHRQSGHDAQSQRDLLRVRQFRVAADEEQAQEIVPVVLVVEVVDELRFDVFEVGQLVFVGQRGELLFPTRTIQTDVATDEDQPGCRIARRAAGRAAFNARETGVLKRLLRRVEIAEVSPAAPRWPAGEPR